jgi:hypothetical protein
VIGNHILVRFDDDRGGQIVAHYDTRRRRAVLVNRPGNSGDLARCSVSSERVMMSVKHVRTGASCD